MESPKKVSPALALCAVGALAFLWLVFPTPYEYTRSAPDIWRVNRFTGIREISTDDGWMTSSQMAARERQRQDAEAESERQAFLGRKMEIEKIVDRVTIEFSPSWWDVRFDNPTDRDFTVKRVTTEYWVTASDGGLNYKVSGVTFSEEQEMPSRSQGAINLVSSGYDRRFPDEIVALPPGKRFEQRVRVEFWEAGPGKRVGPFFRDVVKASK